MRSSDRRVATVYDLGEERFTVGLNDEYSGELAKLVAETGAAMSAIDGMEGEATAKLSTKQFFAETKKIDAELKRLDKMKAEPKANLDTKLFDAGAAELMAEKKALGRKVEIPVDMDRDTLRRGSAALRGLNKDLDKNDSHLKRWFQSLSKVRVQMGPLSGTLRQFALAFSLLGPVIFGVIGAASGLIGVLGTGLAGATAVGIGALGGLAGAALGVGTVINRFGPELSGQVQQVKTRWESLTASLRKPFLDTAADGFRTLNQLLPMFADQTKQTFGVAANEAKDWFKMFRSPEVGQALADMLGNFRKGLPGVSQGLQSLTRMMLNLGQSGSKFLPSLNQGFARWAQNLQNSIGRGAELDQKVGRLVDHMQSVGHFAQASGRLLVNFFNAGANSGQSMLDSLTGVFNKWSAWMNTIEGQKSLQDFFGRSEAVMRQLVPAIARMGTALANVSTAFEPLTLGGAAALNGLATAAAAIPAPLLQAAGAALILSKAFSFFKGAAVLGALRSIIPIAGALRAAIGVGGLAGAFEAMGIGSAGALAAVAPAAAVFGAVAIGGKVLSGVLDNMADENEKAIARWENQEEAVAAMPARYDQARTSLQNLKAAQKTYNEVQEKTGKDSRASRAALVDLNKATRDYNNSLAPLRQSLKQGFQAGVGGAAQSLNNFNHYLQSSDTYVADFARQQAMMTGQGAQFDAALARNGTSVLGVVRSLKQVGLSAKQVGLTDLPVFKNALQQLNQGQQTAAVRLVNTARGFKNLAPITGQAGAEVGKFIQKFGRLPGAKRTVISTNAPQQVGQIVKLSNNLGKLGQKKTVARIMTEDAPATQKIRQLENKLNGIKAKRTKAKVDVDASDATGKAAQIKAAIDKIPAAKTAIMHLLGAPAAISAANQATSAANAFNGVSTRTFVFKTVGSPPSAGGNYRGGYATPVPGFATGADDKIYQRAYAQAMRNNPRDGSRGARVARPTFLTGEENQTEFVIATNPRYRRSNMRFLKQAAMSFGQQLVPGYKGGKGKKKHKPGAAPGADSWDYQPPGGPYDLAHEQIDYLQDTYDVARRAYDLNQPAGVEGIPGIPTVSQLADLLQQEVAQYRLLQTTIIPALMSASPHNANAKLPPVHGKGKAREKSKKARDAVKEQNQNAASYNKDLSSGQNDLAAELKAIPNRIAALQLDIFEMQNAAATNTALGANAYNKQIYDAFTQYSGNVANAFGAFRPTTAGAFNPPVTPGTSAYYTGAGSGLSDPSSAFLGGGGGGTTGGFGGSGGDVTVVNNFATVPPDPLTWSQQTQFELSAL